jgi:hypothetical protein
MELQQPAEKLSVKVVEEKEKQLALELMVKYNLGGAAIGESRTSSVILGLSSPQKKKKDKVDDKDKSLRGDETKSMISSKRSTTGKFEGGTKFGDFIFAKKGHTSGNQRW